MNQISHSTILLLVILYVTYVICDYTTTQWLIANDSAGIANEANPLAKLLYNYYDLAGMLVAKSMAYLTISLTIISIEARYQKSRRTSILKELTLLTLIGYSLAIVVNNSSAILVISAAMAVETSALVKTFGIMLSITLTTLISISRISKFQRKDIQVTIMKIVIPQRSIKHK